MALPTVATLGPRAPRVHVDGPAGRIACIVDRPAAATPVRGVVVVCHPHPLHGGTMDNKVVQTLTRAFLQLGFASVRFNYRGVDGSDGAWDEGRGEVDDALAVIAAAPALAGLPADAPVALGGFSFGGYVAASCAARLAAGRPERGAPVALVLAGTSVEKQDVPPVPPDTLLIHGDEDELVALASVFAWARPQHLPVLVFPGVGHFFHGALGPLKSAVVRHGQALAALPPLADPAPAATPRSA